MTTIRLAAESPTVRISGEGDTLRVIDGGTVRVSGGEFTQVGVDAVPSNRLLPSSIGDDDDVLTVVAGAAAWAPPVTVDADHVASVGLMDRATDGLVAFIGFFGLSAGDKVYRADPANSADRGLYTWDGSALGDQVDLLDGTHGGENLLVGAALRDQAASNIAGERYHISEDAAGTPVLQRDGLIDVRVEEHAGHPHAHRFAVVDGAELLDDTERAAIDSGWPDGTMGVSALGGGTAYTFCAGQNANTVIRTTVGGTPFGSPIIMDVAGTPSGLTADVGMVLWDDDTGLLVGFAHVNRADGTSCLSLVKWDGNTGNDWEWLGDAVTPHRPEGSGGSANNIGSFTPVLVVGDYIYAWHRDQLATGTLAASTIHLAVSRVNLRDMFDAAAIDTVEAWSKWDGTGWTEPGIEGEPADIAPAGFEFSHLNAFTIGDDLVLLATKSGLPLRALVSTDGVAWSDPTQIEQASDFRHPYATFYSGEPSRPNEVQAGDTPVIWSVRHAAGDTAFTDDTTVVEQFVRGYSITAAPTGGGGTVDVVSNVAQDRFLGRISSGSGDSEELTPSQARTLLALVVGTNVQAYDAELDLFAALTSTAFGRSLLELANAAALSAALGLGTAAMSASGDFAPSDIVQVVAEGSAAGVNPTTTPTEVCALTLPDIESGDVIDLSLDITITQSSGSPVGYVPVLRMNGNVLVTLTSPANVPSGTTRTASLRATILSTGAAAQTARAEYQLLGVPVGPVTATATESQTAPTVSLWLTSTSASASQTATQVMAIARILRA